MRNVSIMFQLSDAQVELLTKTDNNVITIDANVIRLSLLRPDLVTDIGRNIDVVDKTNPVEDKRINIVANLDMATVIEQMKSLYPTVSTAKVFKDKHGNVIINKAKDSSGKFTKPDPNT